MFVCQRTSQDIIYFKFIYFWTLVNLKQQTNAKLFKEQLLLGAIWDLIYFSPNLFQVGIYFYRQACMLLHDVGHSRYVVLYGSFRFTSIGGCGIAIMPHGYVHGWGQGLLFSQARP